MIGIQILSWTYASELNSMIQKDMLMYRDVYGSGTAKTDVDIQSTVGLLISGFCLALVSLKLYKNIESWNLNQ